MKIVDSKVMFDFVEGMLDGEGVSKTQKFYRDIKHIYKNIDSSIDDNQVMYEVYTYEPGTLNWGLTVLYPISICKEYNMTRGHFHLNLNCAEYYFCLKGEGLLLLMNEHGECWSERMQRGSIHYIDGTLAHRCINTGETELRIGACWPSDSGHDYDRIEKFPFTQRIFEENI